MATSIQVYGACEFEAPGLHWSSLLRAFVEQPTDSVGHAAIVEKAECELHKSLPWVLAAAKVYGLFFFFDGAAISIVLPGEQAPPRMVLHLIGVIEPVKPVRPAEMRGALQ